MLVKKYPILQAEKGQDGTGAGGGDSQESAKQEQSQSQSDSGDTKDDYSGLREALKKERDLKRSLEAQLKKFQGVDPEKYQSYLEAESKREQEEQERSRRALEEKAEYDKALAALKEDHTKQQQTLSQRVLELEKLLAEKEKAIASKNIATEFQKAFLEAGGIPSSTKLLLGELKSHLVYDEKGDKISIIDPATGVEVTDKKGGAIALKEWIEGYKATHANLFKAENNANGSGANPSRNGTINNKIDFSKLSSIEKMRIGRQS